MLLPQPLPDETLHSRFIRYRLCSGEVKTHLLRGLFGKQKVVLHPYLTAYINNFAKLFNEDADNIVEKQTLFPLFAFFLSHYRDAIKQAQLGDNGALALRECQLSSFKGKVPLVIKSCPMCVKQDIYDHGIAYWHRAHQIPGITACVKHEVRLIQIEAPTEQRLHYDLLPQLAQGVIAAQKEELLLADFSVGLLSLLDSNNTAVPLTQIYRDKLAKRGFVTKQGKVRREKVMICLMNFWHDLTNKDDSIIPKSSDDYSFLRGLLDGKSPQHPYKHLLFLSWLFDSPNELFLTPEIEGKTVYPQLDLTETKEIEIYSLNLLRSGHSLAAVSRLTGKSRCYLKRIAALSGTSLNLKPKFLTLQVKKEILQLAELGINRANIAAKLNISVGSVEQEISSCSGLVKQRKQRHFESKRRRCRGRIARYLRTNPHALRREIKEGCNAEFYWLYRKDRDWLEENLPAVIKTKRHSRVDWQQRDIELSDRVEKLLSSVEGTISKTDLDKLIGGHGWLIKYRAKLPLTMMVYESLNTDARA